MASERQIAANRRNAAKSTGPRSRAGKMRARHNAYQHGLTTSPISSAAVAKQVEKLVRKIAGKTKDAIVLEHARDIAHATFDIARARRVRVALIERNSIGRSETPTVLERTDLSTTMPSQEPERTAEAIRRALPELIKLDRYESRAAARRDKAIRNITISRR
jgi:hypothetical protein